LTAFSPIPPMKAVEFVEAAGIADGRRLIADRAAAGLVKSYALVIETLEADGKRAQVRGLLCRQTCGCASFWKESRRTYGQGELSASPPPS